MHATPRSFFPLLLLRALAIAVILTACMAAGLPLPAASETPGAHMPPVDGTIVEGFRRPQQPYGPGNRGIDYDTTPGDEVSASASGVVTFAGKIGPAWHLVVLHDDGLRTSYSFLTSVNRRRGDQVNQGDVVGVAGEQFHFGVRAGDTYIDPNRLFSGDSPMAEISLIPIEQLGSQNEHQERRGLLRQLGSTVFGGFSKATQLSAETLAWLQRTSQDATSAAMTLTAWVAQVGWDYAYGELMNTAMQLQVAWFYVKQFSLPGTVFYLLEQQRRAQRFMESQENCTPLKKPVPPPPKQRRIMVMVNGLNSKGGQGALRLLRPESLGYGSDEVVEFSYRGDQQSDMESGSLVTPGEYVGSDTEGDLKESADKLRQLLTEIRAANPGVPVDIVAHSQGGLVSRLALGNEHVRFDSRLPAVENLVMLATPNHGVDVATANSLFGTTGIGSLAQEGGGLVPGLPDPSSDAMAQLSEASPLMRELNNTTVPHGTRVTSIAAEGDLLVGALNSSLSGATNVLVPSYGPNAHSDMVATNETRREVGLALAGLGPTCRNVMAGVLLGGAISWSTDALGAGVNYLALRADVRSGRTHQLRRLMKPIDTFDKTNGLIEAARD